MRGIFRIFAILAIFINIGYPVCAENSKQVKEILDRAKDNLQDKYDYQFNVTTTMQTPMGAMVSKDVIFTKKDGRMRKETKMSMESNGETDEQLMVFDGEIDWIYDKKTNVVRKINMKKAPQSSQNNFQLDNLKAFFSSVEYDLNEAQEDGKDYYILKTKKPIEIGKVMKNSMETWLNKKTWLIEKQKMHGVQTMNKQSIETTATLKYSDYKFNQKYPDSLFTFEVPKLASVIDATSEMNEYMGKPKDKE